MSEDWRLSLLGPVRLQRRGVDLPLPIKRGQALLVLLALQGRQLRSRIAAALWPALDESTARRNLRRELARLREQGAADLVRSDGDWLALAEGVICDATAVAPPAGLRDIAAGAVALTLADGLELDDAEPFQTWLETERKRLAGRARAALADQAAALEATGDAAAALAAVQALLAVDPLHEAMHLAAMRLLVTLGQRDAAVAQYEHCRRLLASELGLEPMAATLAFAASLRSERVAGAESTEQPVTVQAPLRLPASMPFNGREAEVGELEDWWQRSAVGGGVAWIEGEGGIGKSRLASEFVAAHGAFALVACRASDRAVPFAAMARALRALGGDSPAAVAVAPWAQAELAPLLVPADAGTTPPAGSDRARLQQALTLAWRALAGDGENFDAVVVDDFHLADDASQQLIGQIAAAAPATRLLLLLRGGELGAAGRQAMEAVQTRPQGALVIALAPLPEDAVLALVRQVSGAGDATRFARRLERATAGNPFFLAETLRHLAEAGLLRADAQGRWQTPFDEATQDYAELPVPASVEAAVQARARRLPQATRRLLEAASLAAEPFSPAQLGGACALSEMEALSALEPALEARLLRDTERGGYAFTHDLVAHALRRALPAARQRLLHRRLALAAEQAGAEPALVAAHLESAGENARAVAFRIAAAERAGRLHSSEDARRQWEQALADGPTVAQRIHILGRVGMIWRQFGLGPKVDEAIATLDALRETTDDPDAAIEASVRAAYLCYQCNRNVEVLARVDAALAAGIRDPRMRMIALESRCSALMTLGQHDEARNGLEAALALPEATAFERIRLLGVLTKLEHQRGHKAQALAVCERQLLIIQAVGDRRFLAMVLCRIGIIGADLGLRERAVSALEQARTLAAELQLVEPQREALRGLADLACAEGDGDHALALTQQGWDLAPTFARAENRSLYRMLFHRAHLLRGELGAALTAGAQAWADVADLGEPDGRENALCTTVDAVTLVGWHAQARALLAQAPVRLSGEMTYFTIRVVLCRALLALCEGRADAAQAELALLDSHGVGTDFECQALEVLRRARLQLLRGEAEAALAAVQALPRTLPTVALQAEWQATRLQALTALGCVDAGAQAEAGEALAGGRLPPLESLELRHALWQGLAAQGDAAQAAAVQAALAAEVQRLADSLDGQEEARRCLLAQWRVRGIG